ncbi:MAG: nucleoside/nucleotide kinase family protein [Butyrivibrio sp.]|nr:nucleoside/nucleotide kinase family protein [Butyrivibrio sp.]
MEYKVNINGIDVDAEFSEKAVNEIFLPLLLMLEKMQIEKGKRLIVMVAAPPGAGKSTLVSFLEELSKKELKNVTVQAIGMDGFHRRQEYLLSHTVEIDKIQRPMVDIKGAPVTFDLDLLKSSVKRLLEAESMGWPSYDRHLHNPVDNAIDVNGDIILLEGNYLLLEQEGWRDISELADYTIFIRADEKLLRNRLIKRKADSGNSILKAEQFVDFSDMKNVKICLENSKKANLELEVKNGDFTIISKI